MTIRTESTAILVNVLDAEGLETGRCVFVYLDYIVEVDAHYGANADGQHGERRVEYQLLKVYLDKQAQRDLLVEEQQQVLADAELIFYGRQKHL